MLFNSFEFIFLFLPVTLLGFFFFAKTNRQLAAAWLAAASLFFYGFWNPPFVLLLLGSICFNYAMGHRISRDRPAIRSKRLLVFAVTANLVLLGIYKYANFFIVNLNALTDANLALTNVVLPLGISFFTFTQIAFLSDAYRGSVRERNFGHYLLFVTYFPHLIAGPLLHHKEIMPQFEIASVYRLNLENVQLGLAIFVIGLAKKLLLADAFSDYANPVFSAAAKGEQLRLFEAWAGALSFTLQIYFDFSGYSDMAIGMSKMFGIDLPINFNSPYKAANFIEFWRRWHITLSRFLRDYLYIPLGGNRKGPVRRYVNLMLTMLLGGLWHGANWTFVAWGGLHGVFLGINHAWRAISPRRSHEEPGRMLANLSTTVTFVLVIISWVFFRSDDMRSALALLQGMALCNGLSVPKDMAEMFNDTPLAAFVVGNGLFATTRLLASGFFPLVMLGLIVVFGCQNSQQLVIQTRERSRLRRVLGIQTRPLGARAGIGIACLLALCLFSFSRGSEFLYFQF